MCRTYLAFVSACVVEEDELDLQRPVLAGVVEQHLESLVGDVVGLAAREYVVVLPPYPYLQSRQ